MQKKRIHSTLSTIIAVVFFGLLLIPFDNPKIVKAGTKPHPISPLVGPPSGLRFSGAYPVEPGPRHLALGDFNRDGKLDIVTSSNAGYGNKISVLLGRADGTFYKAPNSPIRVGKPESTYVNSVFVHVVDLNNDNYDDIISVNASDSSLTTCINDGTGNFTTYSVALNARGPIALATGDVNRDGNLDVVIACNGYPEKLEVRLGNGVGTFSGGTTINRIDLYPTSVVMALFVGNDNFLDVVVTDYVLGTVSLLQGDGTGNFTQVSRFNVTDNFFPGTLSITLANTNNDPYFDLVVSISNGSYDGITIMHGGANGTFTRQPPMIFGASMNVGFTAVAYPNTTDIMIVAPVYESGFSRAHILSSSGNGVFDYASDSPILMDSPFLRSPRAAVIADFNKDGKLDAAFCNQLTNDVTIYLQQ
jgi:hypothetical protein